MSDNCASRVTLLFTCIFVGIVSVSLLMNRTSAVASPQVPGVEVGPDHARQANAGQTIVYNHTLTNTGTTTDTFWLEVVSTQGWPVELLGGDYPTGTLGTLALPQVGAQMTVPFQVSLTVPLDTAGVTEITIITATSQLSATVQDVATDTTIVLSQVYLPLVMRRWPPVPYPTVLHPIDNEDGDGVYAVTWSIADLAQAYSLEEDDNASFSSPTEVYNGAATSWSVPTPGKTAGIYYYRVRGRNTWGYGGYSNVEVVTVLLPHIPTLNSIDNADGDENYTVTWNATARATSYTLEEDTDLAFGSPTTMYDGAEQSWSTTNQASGTYYYRVRANGPTGHSGWSNTQTVTVLAPTPYNLRAQSIVLQLSDMPPGYALDEDESGPVEFSDEIVQMGVVDAYEVMYTNMGLFFSGTPSVYNLAAVFRTPEGAQSYIQRVKENADADPEASPISSPTLGDETIAYQVVAADDPFIAYIITFRKGNLVAAIITAGLLGVAQFDDTLWFAEIVLGKINNQIAVVGRAIGYGRTAAQVVYTDEVNIILE